MSSLRVLYTPPKLRRRKQDKYSERHSEQGSKLLCRPCCRVAPRCIVYASKQINTQAFFGRVSTITSSKHLFLRKTAYQSTPQRIGYTSTANAIRDQPYAPFLPHRGSRSTHPSTLPLLLFQLFNELHKPLLMHHPGKLTIPQHAHIPQPQLHKTLIHQIHR